MEIVIASRCIKSAWPAVAEIEKKVYTYRSAWTVSVAI